MIQKVQELMSEKIVRIDAQEPVAQAARLMREHDVGSVLVTREGRLAGIVTDRDVVVRCLADGDDPQQTAVGKICTDDLATLGPDDDADHAVRLMQEKGVRRIPVVRGDEPLGVLSIGDLAVDRDANSALGRISAAAPNH